jgi:uncharacterized integral membrane protein
MIKIVSRILILTVAALVVVLAVANRQPTTLSLDPLPFEVTGPLYALLVAAAFLGIAVGAVTGWASVLKWRQTARRQRREIAALEQRLKSARTDQPGAPLASAAERAITSAEP